jgi:CHAT domain-containing protein
LHLAVVGDTRGELAARVRNYARVLARPPVDARAALPGEPARALGELLLSGVAESVRSSSRVYAALDGYLAGLPLETVVCPGEDGPLVSHREIVRAPAASLLRYLRAREAHAPTASSVLAIAPAADDLEGAAREVDQLASRYGAVRLRGPGREALVAALDGPDVIHMASHVRVDAQRPWHSGILIGREGAGAPPRPSDTRAVAPPHDPLALSASDSSELAAGLPGDPYVRASEISARRLDARLVVLSGCESALGRATLAEGVLGIALSFVCAGGQAVVASLWEVDDATTADLMETFYREMAAGRTVGAALRASQLALREKRPHPFFWAGFVVIGDGDVGVVLAERPPRRAGLLVALAGGLTMFIIGGWVIRNRRAKIAS